MAITFEREALYAEVWASPITTLAKKYNLSDNGLRKVCKKLQIPLPPRGYWARIAVGQKIAIPALPKTDGPAVAIAEPTEKPPISTEHASDQMWLERHVLFEAEEAHRITVSSTLDKPHPHVAATLKVIKKIEHELIKSREAYERKEERKSNPSSRAQSWQPNFDHFRWSQYISCGQYLEMPPDALPLRVSLERYERGLRIYDAIIRAAERRGFATRVEKSRLWLDFDDVSMTVRISEQFEKVKTGNLVPTGRLRIFFGQAWSERKMDDSPQTPLENQLNEFFCRVYKIMVKDKEEERQRAVDRRRSEEAAARRRAEEELRLERKRQYEEEQERIRKLLEEAATWEKVSTLRQYLVHLQASALNRGISTDADTELGKWLLWACSVADDLDPTLKRAVVPVTE